MTLRTNRDLYTAVLAEIGRRQSSTRSLGEYLAALRTELLGHSDAHGLSPDAFVAAIAAAFVAEPEPIDTDVWRREDLSIDAGERPATFADAERILRSQILDMEDARATGADRDEHRFFGMAVTRRGRGERAIPAYWFNWEPAGYVECGVVGAFGGWEPGDGGGRRLVPGPVAVIGPDGEVTGAAPDEIDRPTTVLGELTWSDIADFLWAGQSYE